jgi:hypothetical protein
VDITVFVNRIVRIDADEAAASLGKLARECVVAWERRTATTDVEPANFRANEFPNDYFIML